MGNPALTGDDTGETTITTANVASWRQAYTIAVPGRHGQVFSPTSAAGKVYAAGYHVDRLAPRGRQHGHHRLHRQRPWSASRSGPRDLGHFDDRSRHRSSPTAWSTRRVRERDRTTGSGCWRPTTPRRHELLRHPEGLPRRCGPRRRRAPVGPNVTGARVFVADADAGQPRGLRRRRHHQLLGHRPRSAPVVDRLGDLSRRAVDRRRQGLPAPTLFEQVVVVRRGRLDQLLRQPGRAATPLFTVALPAEGHRSVVGERWRRLRLADRRPERTARPAGRLRRHRRAELHRRAGGLPTSVARRHLPGRPVTRHAGGGQRSRVCHAPRELPGQRQHLEVFDAAGSDGLLRARRSCASRSSPRRPRHRLRRGRRRRSPHVVFVGGRGLRRRPGRRAARGSLRSSARRCGRSRRASVRPRASSAHGTVFVGGADGFIHAYELPSS